jgi:hypothetical protein
MFLNVNDDRRDEDYYEHSYYIDVIFENEWNWYKLHEIHKFIAEIKNRWVGSFPNKKKQYYIRISLNELFRNDSNEIINISKYFKVIDIIDESQCLKESNGYLDKQELIETLQEYYIPLEERVVKPLVHKKRYL